MAQTYKRILLKLSGEGLKGDKGFGVSYSVISSLAEQIKHLVEKGVQVCVVVGGGNFCRGAKEAEKGMNRTTADQIGMLATVMNSLYLQTALEETGVQTKVMSGIEMPKVCEPYIYNNAIKYLAENKVIIFAAGTGNPYFTTDTGAVLRALEMHCDIMFKATQVDGIYDSDPHTNKNAHKYLQISHNDYIRQQLKVLDIAAVSLAKENNLPIAVFAQKDNSSIENAVFGKSDVSIIK